MHKNYKKSHNAFSMIELVFVIVVIGILSKFGVEFIAEAYKNFIYSKINYQLQSNSTSAIEIISAKLQYRIKDSAIAKRDDDTFDSISDSSGNDYTVLEWVGTDIDGFKGNSKVIPNFPNWSGVIDIKSPQASQTRLHSPQTDTTEVNELISKLSDGNSGINDSAIYFIGSNSYVSGYAWDGVAMIDQSQVMHPINSVVGSPDLFAPAVGDFSGIDIYEYYKLAWTAYAVKLESDDNLTLYYDYQPWMGEKYIDGKSSLIMKDVSSFKFTSIGSMIKIQVCVKSDLISDNNYSICKEKSIY